MKPSSISESPITKSVFFNKTKDKTRFTTTWYTATPFNQDFSTFQLNLKETLLNKAKNLEKNLENLDVKISQA